MNIIQIGANSGRDDAYDYIVKNQESIEKLVLVEPLEQFNQILLDQYHFIKNISIENIVIVDDTSLSSVIFNIPDSDTAISSINKDHIYKHGLHAIKELSIKCCTINNLFEKYNLSHLNYLFVDAEGLDDAIIRSIDFSKYTIDTIEYENLHINYENLKNFLNQKGYDIVYNVGINGWSDRATIRK